MTCILKTVQKEVKQEASKINRQIQVEKKALETSIKKRSTSPSKRIRQQQELKQLSQDQLAIQGQFKFKLRNIEEAQKAVKSGYTKPGILLIMAGVFKAADLVIPRQKQRIPSKIKTSPKSAIGIKSKQKIQQIGKEKVEQVPVVVPDVRLDSLPKSKQNQIINNIIMQVLGTAALTRASGRTVKVPQSRLRGGIGNLRRFIFAKLSRKKFVFTPDIYSIIFGIKAKPKEKLILLKPRRFFTGLERRKIV